MEAVTDDILLTYIKQIPAVIAVWLFILRPHLQKIEGLLSRNVQTNEEVKIAVENVSKAVDAMASRISAIDERVEKLEEWRDHTPVIGHKNGGVDGKV